MEEFKSKAGFKMKLEQKRKLYMKDAEVLHEYSAKDITTINEKEIRFSDGYRLDLMECKDDFPVEAPDGRKYIGARFSGSFWQFFVEQGSVVVLCDNMEDYCGILSNIGFIHSLDLS